MLAPAHGVRAKPAVGIRFSSPIPTTGGQVLGV